MQLASFEVLSTLKAIRASADPLKLIFAHSASLSASNTLNAIVNELLGIVLTASSNCSLISVEGVAGSIPCAFNSAANKAASLISFDGAGVVVVRARPLKIDLKKDSSSCDNPDDFFEPTASFPVTRKPRLVLQVVYNLTFNLFYLRETGK